jgi:hypothetical protein
VSQLPILQLVQPVTMTPHLRNLAHFLALREWLPLHRPRPRLLLSLPVWLLLLRLQWEPLVPLPVLQEQERAALDPQAQVLLLAVQAQARGVKEKVTWLK